MKNLWTAAVMLSAICCAPPDMRISNVSVSYGPMSDNCEPPVVEEFLFEGNAVRASRLHCIDKMGPDESGHYEFYYDYEDFEFSLDATTLFGRTYADQDDADLRGVRTAGDARFLGVGDLESVLVRAAVHYFRSHGRTQVVWLDPSNEENGYSLIP